MRSYAVIADSAPLPAGTYDQVINVVTSGPTTPNVTFSDTDVVNVVGRPLTSHEEDWLKLLYVLHLADLLCHRGTNEDWTRRIVVSLYVRDPEFVGHLNPLVREIFERLTFDALEIHVEHDKTPAAARYPSRAIATDVDSVALLSGGLDSASAAASLVAAGASPCLVSSKSSSHVVRAQNTVIKTLEEHFGAQMLSAGFRIGLKHKNATSPLPNSDLSQRGRTLLFTGVACLIAAAKNINRVVLGENGIMAINCPLTAGRIAGFSTQTAHPDALTLMSKLSSEAFACKLEIQNPLLFNTKAEVVKDLIDLDLEHLIPSTHSCWIARRSEHCGKCIPCIVRRFSAEIAKSRDTSYTTDVFCDPMSLDEDGKANIGDYMMFINRFRTSSDEELMLNYEELNVEGGVAVRERVLHTHRQWAESVHSVAVTYPGLARTM